MSGRSDDELRRLVDSLLKGKDRQDCLEDIERGEQLLSEHPAPQVRPQLLMHIKTQLPAIAASSRKHRIMVRLRYAATVAAAIFIVVGSMFGLFDAGNGGSPGVYKASIIPTALWESNDIAHDDPELAFYAAEIEQIEDEIIMLQSGSDTGVTEGDVSELEMEFIEIQGEFWKG
jgi:hypothetical protein